MNDYTPEAWHTEYDALISCRNDMSEYGMFSLNKTSLSITDALRGLIEKHGQERVSMVFATTIRMAPWDKRYIHSVHEWAQSIPPFPAPPHYSGGDFEHWQICTNAHPCAVNIAARIHMAGIAGQNLDTPKAQANHTANKQRGSDTR